MKKPPKKVNSDIELSIIIVSYNNQNELSACLDSIYKFNNSKLESGKWELLVVDNASTDNTSVWLAQNRKNYPNAKATLNRKNLGFAAGNNFGVRKTSGQYVLFLNPDTVVEKESIVAPLKYISSHQETGAVTAKTVLGNGQLDATCHRGFPTPWNAFCYFSGLTRLFPKNRVFSGYTLGYLDINTIHQVDAINGAFFMLPRSLGDKMGWFDEAFFWKGEDLDLSYRIKQSGFKIIYLPKAKVWHFKGSSQGHKPGSRTLKARFGVMRLFYQKHYQNKYPWLIRQLVFLGIDVREFLANLGI